MTAISEDAIRELAAFEGSGLVTSCYLDLDLRRYPMQQDYEHQLDSMVRSAKKRANGTEAVHSDLERISDFIKGGLDRTRTKGIVLFSSSADDLWHVVELPVRVVNRIVIGPSPAVQQLESVVQTYNRIGVLIADRQAARAFVFELGEVIERSDLFDALPRDYDHRGHSERGDTDNHVEELVHQHLRHAVDAAFKVFQEVGFAHLLLGGAQDVVAEMESHLHPYLLQRYAGRIDARVDSRLEDILEATLSAEADLERRREQANVERLRAAVNGSGKGVVGLEAVLDALHGHRLEQLLVSSGFEERGWRCAACGRLATVGRACPSCAEEMGEVDDIVEEAVEEALRQSCAVDVCVGSADLDVLGRVGALLRY